MADSPTPNPTPPGSENGQAAPRLALNAQYIKDMSFENPRAPASLQPNQGRPEITVRVDVQAREADAAAAAGDALRYEIVLVTNVDAKLNGEPVFVFELSYAGLFSISNVPRETVQPLLMIECPRLLFPFARRIVADVTRDGGFPPLMIDPIDFIGLYRQRLARAQAAQQQSGQQPAPPAGSA